MQEKKEENLTNIQLAELEDKFDGNYEAWTKSHLIDRLKQHLATAEYSVSDCKDNLQCSRVFDSRRYYNQAHHFLKIGAFKPVPAFVVNLSDLTPKLIEELYSLDEYDRNYVLKQATGRIFEDVNFELYHNSVSKVLEVRLQS
jgi:hypothetical protein